MQLLSHGLGKPAVCRFSEEGGDLLDLETGNRKLELRIFGHAYIISLVAHDEIAVRCVGSLVELCG